ncbi:MAG: glutaredoxin domain-containing protein [Candidatus Omnitrophota bacterium]
MPEVTVYSTPSCSYCIRLKSYLNQKGINFTNIDVSSDAQSLEKMISLSGQMGVPVININGEIVVGFDKDKIDRLL